MTTAGARSLSLASQAVCAATAAAQTLGSNLRDVANQGLNGISGSSTRLLSSALTWATSPAQSLSSSAGSSRSWQTVTFICMANLLRARTANPWRAALLCASQVTPADLSAIDDAEAPRAQCQPAGDDIDAGMFPA